MSKKYITVNGYCILQHCTCKFVVINWGYVKYSRRSRPISGFDCYFPKSAFNPLISALIIR